MEAIDEGRFLAHFGYTNPNATTVEPSADENKFSPDPPNRGQPKAFGPGRVADAFQVQWNGDALTWQLTDNELTVSSRSNRCAGSITVVKRLVPADDAGRFDLKVDGVVAGDGGAVGDGGTTGRSPWTAARTPLASRLHGEPPSPATTSTSSAVTTEGSSARA